MAGEALRGSERPPNDRHVIRSTPPGFVTRSVSRMANTLYYGDNLDVLKARIRSESGSEAIPLF